MAITLRLAESNNYREELYFIESIGFVKLCTFESKRILPLGYKVILKKANERNRHILIIKLETIKKEIPVNLNGQRIKYIGIFKEV